MDGRSCLPSPKEGGSISIKAMQSDSVRGVDFAVSLSLHCTAKSPPHTLRLMAALAPKIKTRDVALHPQQARL